MGSAGQHPQGKPAAVVTLSPYHVSQNSGDISSFLPVCFPEYLAWPALYLDTAATLGTFCPLTPLQNLKLPDLTLSLDTATKPETS